MTRVDFNRPDDEGGPDGPLSYLLDTPHRILRWWRYEHEGEQPLTRRQRRQRLKTNVLAVALVLAIIDTLHVVGIRLW